MSAIKQEEKAVGNETGKSAPGMLAAAQTWLQEKGHTVKFIRHLLGMDQPQPGHLRGPAHSANRWSPSLRGVKLSDAFQGIHFTTNFLFFLLFLGLFLWLFVIYWVRHHEPFANQVLGEAKHSATTAADRALVNGIKKTFPVHTSATMGEIYVPGSESLPAQAPVNTVNTYPEAVYQSSTMDQGRYSPYGAAVGLPGNYMIGVQTGSGTKVRTIVSR